VLHKLAAIFDRFFFQPSDSRNLALFRLLYCSALACVHVRQMSRIENLYQSYFAVYFPTPLFVWFGLGQLPLGIVRLFGVVLLLALLSAACGFVTRLALTLAWVSFFFFYGTVLGFEKPEPSAVSLYTFHYNNIVLFILFILSVSPGISLWSVGGLGRRKKSWPSLADLHDAAVSIPAWPVLLIKLTLALAYFGSGLAKLKVAGVLWMDGYTLQAYFLMKYLQENAWIACWLAQYYWICVVLSACSLALELSFIIVPFLPNTHPLTWVYVVAGLGFHILIAVTMKISHFIPFMGLSYLIFLNWPLWQKWLGSFWPLAVKKPQSAYPPQSPASFADAKNNPRTSWRSGIARGFITGYLSTLLFCDIGGIELWPFSDYGVFRGRFHYSQVSVWQIRGVDDTNGARWLRAQDLGAGFEGWFDGTNFVRFYIAHSGRTARMLTMEKDEDLAREGPRFLRDFHQHLPAVLRERFHTLEFVIRSIERDPHGWLVPSDRVLFSTNSPGTDR
jgi:hypothetical protein